MRFISVLLLLLPVFEGPSYAASIKQAYTFYHEGAQYTAAIVTPTVQADATRVIPFSREWYLNRYLIESTRDWVEQQYRERYPKIDPRFFAEMKQIESLYSERSALVVIFKGHNIQSAEILATLRLVWTTKEFPNLPSEDLFDMHIARHRPGNAPYPILQTNNNTDNILDPSWFFGYRNKTFPVVRVGATWEFKQLIMARNSPIDLIPFLVFFAETSGISYNMDPSLMGQGDHIFPEQYILTCDEKMVPYYLNLGFSLIWKKPIRDNNYAMKISRWKFMAKSMEKFAGRAGYKLYKQLSITHHDKSMIWHLANQLFGFSRDHYQQGANDNCQWQLMSARR